MKKHSFTSAFVLNGLFLFLLLGTFYCTAIMGLSNQKISCPFDAGHDVQCVETPLRHIQEWQNVFTVLPSNQLFILLSLASLVLAVFGTKKNIFDKFASATLLKLKYLYSLPCQDHLKEAFSSGILNSKIYCKA